MFYRAGPHKDDKVKSANAFTKSIYSTLIPVLDQRARFLKKLYDEISSGPSIKGRYVDAGAGTTINSSFFGEGFQQIFLLDINAIEPAGQGTDIQYLIGDVQALPLKDNTVDLLSLISAIEHVPDPRQALSEAARVVRPGGEIVIQIPNLFFPADLHTGMLNPFWIPKFARKRYVRMLGHPDFFNEVYSLPQGKEIRLWMGKNMRLEGIRKVVYPAHFVPAIARPLYRLLCKLGILSLIPLGHLYVFKKVDLRSI